MLTKAQKIELLALVAATMPPGSVEQPDPDRNQYRAFNTVSWEYEDWDPIDCAYDAFGLALRKNISVHRPMEANVVGYQSTCAVSPCGTIEAAELDNDDPGAGARLAIVRVAIAMGPGK